MNRPKWNTILDEQKGKADARKQAQRGADYRPAKAGGSGPFGGGLKAETGVITAFLAPATS